jgi:UDP-N-acetylglucosamine 2-epimerase (non-hydrolysing)
LLTCQHKETMQDLVAEFGIRDRQELAVAVSERSTVLSLLRWIPARCSGWCAVSGSWAGNTRTQCRRARRHAVTVLGAMAARRARGRVCHLESGLSSGALFVPFPEELTGDSCSV